MLRMRLFALLLIGGVILSGAVALAQGGYFSAPMIGGVQRLSPLGGSWMYPQPYYPEPVYVAPQPAVLPQTSGAIEADIDKEGRAHIRWQGEPAAVAHIVFALLDAEKKVIIEQKVERLPAEARFPLTNKSAHYRVTVHYLNGTKTTVTSLL